MIPSSWLPWLAATAASYAGPELLAPGPREFDQSILRWSRLVENAESVGVAVARLQNRTALRLASRAETVPPSGQKAPAKAPLPPCVDPDLMSLVAREAAFLEAYRDRVQSARAESDRVRRIGGERTVLPILDDRERSRIQSLSQRSADESRKYLEALAWHRRYAAGLVRRCEPLLEPASGLPRTILRTPSDPRLKTAVIGVGGGRICPENVEADGSVVILRRRRVCYGETTCDCVPTPVLPGAVIGPPSS